MRSILLASCAVLVALSASPAFASCLEPTPLADVPKGASATRDDMLAAQRAVKAYDTAVKQYTECLQQAGDTSNKGNEAVDRLQKVADRFNQELKAFKEKNGAT